ncbi:MAG: N-acetylmuramoyl-L-alanine amidase [Bacteroidales bacterium]|nr:N-acetylmuramoyl-L-alanine amidase [Bacteroidales bacterium]
MKPFFRMLMPLSLALLLAIPVPTRAQGDKSVLQLKTVVIDAGHGGKDAGCVSRDKKTYEKNITLDIAKRLEQKIKAAYPGVTVKMTRSTDKFVELENRAVIANKAGANLFISIHVNSVEKGTSARGFSIHCLGQSARKGTDLYSKNLDLVKRENSVIMLEDDYKTKYQGFDPSDPQSYIIFSLMQNAHLSQSLGFAEDVAEAFTKVGPIKHSRGVSQDPFWVLWRTAMPAVLIEVGFMSNPDDLATMRTEKGRDGIAEGIYQAFKTFKGRYDGEVPVASPVPAEVKEEKPAPVEEKPAGEPAPKEDGVQYGIQVLAIGKDMDPNDPYFLGYRPLVIPSGRIKKYVICTSGSLEEVKKKFPQIQKKIKDSYVVKIENGTTTPVR